MGITGVMGLGVAVNVFFGVIESFLLIKGYLNKMSRSELFTVIVAGMSTIAGTVLVLYANSISTVVDHAATQLIIASLISAPAAIVFAQILIPAKPQTEGIQVLNISQPYTSFSDAFISGTREGMQMVLNIAGVIVVVFACVHLINQGLSFIPSHQPLTLEQMMGYVFAPLCWLAGVPSSEALQAGKLMGLKTIFNEFVAYLAMAELEPGDLSEKSKLIMTYALCGFANFGSFGILVGGLSTIMPDRKEGLAELCFKAIFIGALATLNTGAIISIVYTII